MPDESLALLFKFFRHNFLGSRDHFLYGQRAGVDMDGIGRGFEWSDGAGRVP